MPESAPQQPARVTLLIQLEPLLITPPIWRRLQVNSDCTLHLLHHFLQAAMGWTGRHLYEFALGDRYFQSPDPDFPDDEVLDDRHFSLQELVRVGDRLRYLYDFSANWQHVIAIEAIDPIPQAGTWCSVLDGARACPPDNLSGVEAYNALLDAGPDFDPELFDCRAADAAVQRLCHVVMT